MERSDTRRVLHYLRIAVTALSLTACVLLVALWVRSYSREYNIKFQVVQSFGSNLVIAQGEVELLSHPLDPGDSWPFGYDDPGIITIESFEQFNSDWESSGDGFWYTLGFAAFTYPGGVRVLAVPIWFVTLAAVFGCIIPWLPWSKRFSLRALLIATTLVAVGLGIVVAMS